jgi:hypothetical protein
MTLNDTMRTGESGWAILVRLLVGSVVFLSEGIRKLSYPDVLGSEASPNQYSLFRTDGPFMRVEYLHQLLSGSYTQGQWIF